MSRASNDAGASTARSSGGRARGPSLPALTLVFSLVFAPTSVARAVPDERAARADAEDSTEKPSDADRHFRRGVDLYEDGDMSAAMVEFSRAYQLVPNYKILYNLGQVAYQRQDYVQSLDYLRRYLDEGSDGVSRERRLKIEQDLRRLELRIGRIDVNTRAADDGAEILLDDVHVGVAPMNAPVAANVGQRRVELVRANGQREVHLVDVVGAETVRTVFSRPAPRVSQDVPAAEGVMKPHGLNLLADRPDPTPPAASARAARTTWISWAATGVLAGSAAVTGSLALSASRDLQQRRDAYPLAPGDLDAPQSRARTLALVTDGLLVGTLVMTALSTYLTATAPATESARRPGGGPGQASRGRDSSRFGRGAGD